VILCQKKPFIVSYEFNVIHQVVQGSLYPLYFPTETSEQAHFYQQLIEIPDTCTKQIHAKFGQFAELPLPIEALEVRLLDHYHPPAFIALNHKVKVNNTQVGEVLLENVLRQLSLRLDSVIEWYHWQDENQQRHLELYSNFALDTLGFEEKRYHFYQRLFIEQVNIIKQRMLQHIHQVPSWKKAQKYVQDHHQTLLTYAAQVIKHLENTDLQMYSFSGDYTLPDVFKHIFLCLQGLIGFIEQQFSQYLNLANNTPNYDAFPGEEKIKTSLSVAQLALLIRLFREVDIFPEQNQNNIFRRLSGILSSTHQEAISDISLRGKFYQHDRHTISVLKDKVIAMLNYLNKIS